MPSSTVMLQSHRARRLRRDGGTLLAGAVLAGVCLHPQLLLHPLVPSICLYPAPTAPAAPPCVQCLPVSCTPTSGATLGHPAGTHRSMAAPALPGPRSLFDRGVLLPWPLPGWGQFVILVLLGAKEALG